MGLLPVWRGFTHLYWYAICPATDTAGAGYHSSTLYTLRCARPSGDATTTHHAASKAWPSRKAGTYHNISIC